MKLPWRRILWIYRSAAGGWLISIFGNEWHLQIDKVPQPKLSDIVMQALKSEAVADNMIKNNALIARLMRDGK